MPTATKAGPFSGRTHSEVTRRLLSRRQFHRWQREAERAPMSPLRRERLKRLLTQQEASNAALVGRKTWAKAERDPNAVSPVTLARIARSFALPPSALRDKP